MSKIISVNKSTTKGRKFPVESIIVNAKGVDGDSNSRNWISLMDSAPIKNLQEITSGRNFEAGEFGEHLTVEGLSDKNLKIFDKLRISNCELDIVKVGDKKSEVNTELGNLLIPKHLVQCRTKSNGSIEAGAKIEYFPKIFKIQIITLSDRASQGVYEDRSGPKIKSLIQEYFDKIGWRCEIDITVIPDNEEQLKNILEKAISLNTDVIFTTGGTGVGSKDITVQIVKSYIDKEIPGVMEMIRMKFGSVKPNALLSCGIAGTIGNSLVYTLPGSVRAVCEYVEEITNTLQHLVYMIYDVDVH